ncbi:hypothetical protein K439DRAFT_205281 [Ramaria rubella]|nr:hypothetical protein K439DRAFT_205281 [Ramaria rubella]
MSTRVEKGGPKFKPILKTKARPSATPAPPLQDARTRPSAGPDSSMPPPSNITERTPSVAPMARAPSETPCIQPSRATSMVNQPASPLRVGTIIALPSTGPSRGTPIAVSRSSVAPSTTHVNANVPENRKIIAQKQPKLSILQAEEDRVKKRPARRAKSKRTYAESELEDEPNGQATNETDSTKKRKMATKRKAAETHKDVEPTGEGTPGAKHTHDKRKQMQIQNTEGDDAGAASDSQSGSAPPKKGRRRNITAETSELEGTPELIDPTQVTMGTICEDPGSGRISSRWESSQTLYAEARKRGREERARAILEAEEDERETGRIGAKKASKPVIPGESDDAAAASEETVVENNGQNPDEFSYTESLKASHYAPQVRIGANGEIVLDMESLQVDRAADPEFVEEYSHVEESDQSKFTNSSSWSKRRVVRWGKEDTALFYDALRQFGQNFDLIARVLPGRTYRMCKNKFKAEDKKNPRLIDDALKNGIAVDLNTLSRMTGKDFSGPTPVIEARKALNLGENAPFAAAQTRETDMQTGDSGHAEAQNTTSSDAIVEKGDAISIEEPTVRQSVSSPPSILLSSVVTTRQSESPPPPQSLLGPASVLLSSRTTTQICSPVVRVQ